MIIYCQMYNQQNYKILIRSFTQVPKSNVATLNRVVIPALHYLFIKYQKKKKTRLYPGKVQLNTEKNNCLTQVMSMISFYFSLKNKKTSGFLVFSGGTERNQWHEIGHKIFDGLIYFNTFYSLCYHNPYSRYLFKGSLVHRTKQF